MATIIMFAIMILKWEGENEVQKYDKGGGEQQQDTV